MNYSDGGVDALVYSFLALVEPIVGQAVDGSACYL